MEGGAGMLRLKSVIVKHPRTADVVMVEHEINYDFEAREWESVMANFKSVMNTMYSGFIVELKFETR